VSSLLRLGGHVLLAVLCVASSYLAIPQPRFWRFRGRSTAGLDVLIQARRPHRRAVAPAHLKLERFDSVEMPSDCEPKHALQPVPQAV